VVVKSGICTHLYGSPTVQSPKAGELRNASAPRAKSTHKTFFIFALLEEGWEHKFSLKRSKPEDHFFADITSFPRITDTVATTRSYPEVETSTN
jgi:hypothetical protein